MDLENISVATLIELEEHSGYTLPDLLAQASNIDTDAGSLPPAKVIGAFVFLAGRMVDPSMTYADALDRPLSDLETALEALGTAADPQ